MISDTRHYSYYILCTRVATCLGQARDGAGRGQGWPLQFRFSLVVSVPIVVVAAIILCDAFENLSKTKSINLLCACVSASPSLRHCLRLTYKWKSQAKATNKKLQTQWKSSCKLICCRCSAALADDYCQALPDMWSIHCCVFGILL